MQFHIFLYTVILTTLASTCASSINIRKVRQAPIDIERIKLEVFTRSQCPLTTRFFNNVLLPTYEKLGNYTDLSIIPFGRSNFTRMNQVQEDYSFQCQAGPAECIVNQLQSCAIAKLQTPERYLPYVVCVQGTKPDDPQQEICAHNFSVNHTVMQECANGREGRLLHRRMGQQTNALGVPYVPLENSTFILLPWIFIEGRKEDKASVDLHILLCDSIKAINNHTPDECVATTTGTSTTTSTRPGTGTGGGNNAGKMHFNSIFMLICLLVVKLGIA